MKQTGRRTGLEDHYVVENHKKLRLGYTTGTCAAAASKAAAWMLLTGRECEETAIQTPKGILLHLLVEEIQISRDSGGSPDKVSCAVRKDGGDDIDATNGALIFASVRKTESGISIDGGEGVGRVTKSGLDQPVGNAAINTIPRQMICDNVAEICAECGYHGGISVIITVPRGREIAEKTFNGRLGIVGGISILGTSGIVMPMSEKALVDSIRAEMKMLAANGGQYLVITPGNYGDAFAHSMPHLDLTYEMKSSNFVGETLDMAEELGVKGILWISHIGKFIKLSGGIMNTHSHSADCRAELMASQAARCGADINTVRRILETNTTEEALDVLAELCPEHFQETMDEICRRAHFYMDARCRGSIDIGAILFSSVRGKLSETDNVPRLIDLINRQGERKKSFQIAEERKIQ